MSKHNCLGLNNREAWFMILFHCCIKLNLLCGGRQQPYIIHSPRRRLAVEVQLQNQLENAYNTSLILYYSKNLHFSSLSIRVNTLLFPRAYLFLFLTVIDYMNMKIKHSFSLRRMANLKLSALDWVQTFTLAMSAIQSFALGPRCDRCFNCSIPHYCLLKQLLNSMSSPLNPIFLSFILYFLLGELYVGVWIQLHISHQ